MIGMAGWNCDAFVARLLTHEQRGELRWLRHVPDTELALWMSQARVLFYPSLYEGFGLPPLEVLEGKSEDHLALARSISQEMDFSAFSKLEDSFVPIRLFFDGGCPSAGDDRADGSYRKWSSQLQSEAEWVERIYLRTRILRARWRCGQAPSQKGVHYVKWLMAQWLKGTQPVSQQ